MARFKGNPQQEVFLWVRDRVGYPFEVLDNYRFMLPERQFEMDVAIPALKLGIEVDGLGLSHMGVTGFIRDRIKDVEAQLKGWRVFRFSTIQVRDGSAFVLLERIIRHFVEERIEEE